MDVTIAAMAAATGNRQMALQPRSEAAALRARALVLFVNFLLIILAYYQVKSASRSLLVEHGGAALFPYAWIASAVVLTAFIGFYHRLVERVSRLAVVLGTLAACIVLLVVFRVALETGATLAAMAFYVFVDIFSVVLVEQFWSLTNTITATEQGKRSYWFVGTGGLVGGVLGGWVASFLVGTVGVSTEGLLLSCAATLGIAFIVNLAMGRAGVYPPASARPPDAEALAGWRGLVRDRYLLLIAAVLLCAQLAQPLVEYQFISQVEQVYTEKDSRTAFFGQFFSIMGLVAIAVNMTLTPLVHRLSGAIAGMLVQPVLIAFGSAAFMLSPTLGVVSALKIADRGLSYSINRASKELLYIPVDPVLTYQAKAWIDMLGYRLFKVLGSVFILLATQWLPVSLSVPELGWITFAVCAVWIVVVAQIAREYRSRIALPAFA